MMVPGKYERQCASNVNVCSILWRWNTTPISGNMCAYNTRIDANALCIAIGGVNYTEKIAINLLAIY